MADPFLNYIRNRLDERKQNGLYRKLTVSSGLADFSSNDYLGFRDDVELQQETDRLFRALQHQEKGAQGSRLLCGNTPAYEELEQELATRWSAEAALLFPSGYMANLSLLSSLPYRGDTILYDELIHASCREGFRLSKAQPISFAHQNLEDLEEKLKQANGLTYVVVESIYSMDGDVTPLGEVSALCQQYGAALIVDEAHAGGIFGKQGGGLCDEITLPRPCLARIVTFGKAFGSQGAVILCSKSLKEFLINYARPLIYSTAMGMYDRCRIQAVTRAENKRLIHLQQLVEHIRQFQNGLSAASKVAIRPSASPIHILSVPGIKKALESAAAFRQAGIDARPILAPTVAAGQERIRLIIHATNTSAEIANLCQTIAVLHP